MYKEVTQEYIKEQEDLGVEDVLLKFIEWRTYIAFFGCALTPKDKETLHTIAVQIKEKLIPDNKLLLLGWINKVHVLDDENYSEGLDQVTTDMIFAKALINPQILIEAKQNNLKNQTEERDWLIFLCSPSKPTNIRRPHKIDTRFFELRTLKECDTQSLYKTLWFETIRNARDLTRLFVWIGDENAPKLFVNNQQWDSLTYQNYSLKQFMTDFEIGTALLSYCASTVVNNFFLYVRNNYNPEIVSSLKGRKI